jgi:hypothetical protein
MSVIETETRGTRRKREPAHVVRGNIWRSFFGGAIDIIRDELSVPVQLFRRVRVVVDVDGGLLAFLKAQQRAGKLAIVSDAGQNVLGRNFDRGRRDSERVVCWLIGGNCDHVRNRRKSGRENRIE